MADHLHPDLLAQALSIPAGPVKMALHTGPPKDDHPSFDGTALSDDQRYVFQEASRQINDWCDQMLRQLRAEGCICRPAGVKRDDHNGGLFLEFTSDITCPVHRPMTERRTT